jgi:hypothetical protein
LLPELEPLLQHGDDVPAACAGPGCDLVARR